MNLVMKIAEIISYFSYCLNEKKVSKIKNDLVFTVKPLEICILLSSALPSFSTESFDFFFFFFSTSVSTLSIVSKNEN